MKNLLSLLVFSFITLFGYSQCDEVSINLTNSNECLPLVVYNLHGSAPTGATVSWSWQSNPGGAQLLYDEDDDFIVAIQMTQAGLYQLLMEVTLSDGTLCSEVYEQEIFELEELQTNLQSSYVLCNGLLETEFSILNAEDFTSVNWVIGSEYYSDFTSTIIFEEAGTYILTILAEDIHGCDVFEEVQFEVVEGPSYENTTVSLLPSISDLSCLEIASVHQLNASVSSDYDPQSIYWIDTETTTEIDYSFDVEVANAEAESMTYPLQVQFEECVLDYNFAHAYTVQHQSSFSNSYAGTALCDDQTITLSNTSPQINWSSNFSWAIESANILSETANAITFEYATDGDYNWALNYNGACASEAILEQTVDVDIIQPQLAEGLNQLSCLNAYTLDLSHATVLESDESYDFSWSVISSSGVSMNSISESPSFELNELGAYDVSLTISNTNTSCGVTVVYNDFFNLGELQVLASDAPVRACLLDMVNTSDFILSEQVSQFDYEWTISQGASTINTINGYSNNFQITEAGIYSVSLLVSDTESDCDIELQLTDYLEVYDYPEVEISTNGIEFCDVPASLEATNNLENTPSFGTLSYDWELSSATSTLNNSISETYSFDIQNSGNYTLSITLTNDSTSCSLSDEIAISVEDLNLEFNFEALSPECDGYVFEPMLYATNSVGTSVNYNWEILNNSGSVVASSTLSNPSFELTEASSYSVSLTLSSDINSCENELLFEDVVQINSLPAIELSSEDLTICELPYEINITDDSGFAGDIPENSFEWNLFNEDGLVTSSSLSQEFNYTFTENGEYVLSLTNSSIISNCSVTESINISVNDVQIEFLEEIPGSQCSGYSLMPQNFISSSDLSEVNYLWQVIDATDDVVFSSSSTNPVFMLNNPGNYGLYVQVSSQNNSCLFETTLDNYVDIISPLPYFALDPWAGCDTTYVSIIDSSDFIDSYWIDYGNSYIPDYEIQDTNIVMYTYPYGETTASYVEYYLNLHAEYKFCEASFQDTVRIYPEPIIQIGASGFEGCPPFEVSFTDSSIFAHEEYSSYFWDFGDGETSAEMNPVHVFNQTGVYNVYHSVTSPNGCLSDTVWEIAIEVFEHPVASFIPLINPFCYGMGDVLFQNNSSHDSDSLAYVWSFGLDSSFIESPTYHYDSTNTYHINLHVEDSHGCIDDSTQWVYVEVLDTLVIEPDLQYVTVTDNGVIVVWSDTLDNYFENISVHHQSYETTWDIVYYSDSILPNEFFHDDVATFEVNDYTVVQQDSCGYFSDSSVVHSTVALTAFSPSYQTINLEWTRYFGWDLVESYDIYRSVDGAYYQFLDQVPGDSLNYQDNYLCNVIYGYYVVANHPEEAFQSRSNKKLLEPLFIDYTVPIDLIYTSVNENDMIMTEWQSHYLSTMTYYNIDRWDDYFGWIENYDQASESPYIDTDVGVNSRNYLYKVSYADVCGNEGPNSGLGKNILLEGVQYTSHYDLTWNAYIDWDGGVSQYIIQYYNQLTGAYQDMTTVSGTTLNYTDTELTKDGVDTSYCYRVIAVSAADPGIRSYSNARCFTPGPRDYFPNAFSPNDDGVNEVYKYHGQFAKDLKVEIYSRWGALVYSSDQVTFEWDGRNQQNGKSCAQGTYIFRYEMKGYDGTLIKDEMVIFLLR